MGSLLNPSLKQRNCIPSVKKKFPRYTAFLVNASARRNKLLKLIAIVCIAVTGLIIGLIWGRTPWLHTALENHPWTEPLAWAWIFFLSLVLAELTWRIILAIRYRPVPDCSSWALPRCTVVVPAFNEGAQVYNTLKCLAASHYPRKKLQLIAVDDGSQDDTWHWIKKAKQELGSGLTAIQLHRNQGKRHALYAGFKKSTGEILVTVDSDSMVDPLTLRHLVAPFVSDKRVGGVAGNVRVLNLDKGIIPRMLEVAFVYSFDFIRAGQSVVNSVMCTPGALSAYRRDIVMKVLQEWLNQKYCGRSANIGEDRAMTNLILREGCHVLFQQNAMVHTDIPVNYSKLCKMYLRWARSNVRETLAMSRFAFGRFRDGSMLGARINLLSSWLSLVKAPLILVLTVGVLPLDVVSTGVSLITGTLIFQSLPAGLYVWKYRNFNALWSYVYGFYWFACLFWIKPYALLTSHKSGWLTRELTVDPAPWAAGTAWPGARSTIRPAQAKECR
ncbi:MAG: glycosyltransferase family 2 protein [Proteobacteria bacterium]|nr:glycosyltransferase family 2 protein [Pseudomonadota bacterium]MBU1582990.1 glycosyltransferase family 2 protein [Pseudomonadota bacterium]MBU2631459.1 glycosyltransferase family 2 protein [Pseudomonadota bacterium]